MKTIQVTLEGETPLLMNSPKSMLDEANNKNKNRLKNIDHKVEAEKLAYRMKSKELYVPAEAIKGCLIKSASYKKAGRYALKPIIAGGCRIEPKQIGLGTKNYDIDMRTVVIQRNRIPKARPTIKKWKIDFEIIFNEDMIADPAIIRQCLEEGGVRVGILDFRPSTNGEFGQFKVTKFLLK